MRQLGIALSGCGPCYPEFLQPLELVLKLVWRVHPRVGRLNLVFLVLRGIHGQWPIIGRKLVNILLGARELLKSLRRLKNAAGPFLFFRV